MSNFLKKPEVRRGAAAVCAAGVVAVASACAPAPPAAEKLSSCPYIRAGGPSVATEGSPQVLTSGLVTLALDAMSRPCEIPNGRVKVTSETANDITTIDMNFKDSSTGQTSLTEITAAGGVPVTDGNVRKVEVDVDQPDLSASPIRYIAVTVTRPSSTGPWKYKGMLYNTPVNIDTAKSDSATVATTRRTDGTLLNAIQSGAQGQRIVPQPMSPGAAG